MLRMSCKVISVIGTTGVGKSQFAVELARAVDGEIVNADSMQMYRGLDQITNKHPVPERKGVPHHVMDHTPWDTEYFIHRFKQEAMAAISDIHKRGKTAILVGGTHYYLQSLLFLNKTLDTATRAQLSDAERAVLDGPPDEVFRALQQKDPIVAQNVGAALRDAVFLALRAAGRPGRAAGLSRGQNVAAGRAGRDPRAARVSQSDGAQDGARPRRLAGHWVQGVPAVPGRGP
ncbi:hypothetical protein KL930_003147 [Ogataea haglerorum]|nr:hypothetical protein KL915_002484 [Ogataea haglerorum]KAG7731926.1 hypothetical protein KL948_002859 [Ogataea haglerorum]KAG7774424.1 hypothetical protein KL922_004812 [Ogataea haglerorum]KAG7776025.1 hypothetical protein KL930_003147 [Ogataea haglerorum]